MFRCFFAKNCHRFLDVFICRKKSIQSKRRGTLCQYHLLQHSHTHTSIETCTIPYWQKVILLCTSKEDVCVCANDFCLRCTLMMLHPCQDPAHTQDTIIYDIKAHRNRARSLGGAFYGIYLQLVWTFLTQVNILKPMKLHILQYISCSLTQLSSHSLHKKRICARSEFYVLLYERAHTFVRA